MSVTVNDLASLLRDISISSEPKPCLEELKAVLSTLRLDDIQGAGGRLDLRVLFDCLNSSSKEQVDTCSDVLNKLLSACPPSDVVQRYSVELRRALAHPTESVKLLVLSQVERCVVDQIALKDLKAQTEFLQDVVHCIGAESGAVAAAAVRIAKLLSTGPPSSSSSSSSSGGRSDHLLLFSPPLLDRLRQAAALSDTVRYRVYEVVVEVAVRSAAGLHHMADVGLLPQLIAEAFGGDVLVQLNALEMLSALAVPDHGFDYLESEEVSQRLEKMLSSDHEESGTYGFILPGVVRFFSQLGHDRPAVVLERYRLFSSMLVSMVSDPDPGRRLAALDAVACLAMTPQGKLALHQQGEPMSSCVREIGALVQSSQTEVRVRALDTVYHLLHLPAGDIPADVLSVTQWWFSLLAAQPLDVVWAVARQPFLDLRLAALRVLAAVCALPWGQHLCRNKAGFLEYLLDRSTESSKEGRDAKYAIVDAIVGSSSGSAVFPAEEFSRIVAYHQQGAFFVRAQTEVAIDGTS